MASLATHLIAFLFLFPTGLRRLLFSSSLYLKNPSVYRSKTWYFSEPRWKNFDLYALIIALPVASFSEFFFFLTITGHPTYRFGFFQQSTIVFLFWVLILLIIFREYFDPLHIKESFIFIIAGISFLTQYSILGKGITGISIAVYDLLGALTLVCAGCCFYLSIRPWSFSAEFLLSSGLVFKGTWILQTGLSLYTDTFGLKGCHKISLAPAKEDADSWCDLEEDGLRGVALMRLLFVGHAFLVLVLSFVLFGLLSTNNRLRYVEAGPPLLVTLESESTPMHHSTELGLD